MPVQLRRWWAMGCVFVVAGCAGDGEVALGPTAEAEAPVEAPVEAPADAGLEPAPAPAGDPPAAPELSPVDRAKAALADVTADPKPAHLVRDTHYWTSNELSHFYWYEDLRGHGGVHVGVGTDQNYLLAGWAGSELIIPVDFDQGVVDLHRAYGALFLAHDTPDAFVEAWTEESATASEAIVRAGVPPEDAEAAAVARKRARKVVHERLVSVRDQYRELGIPTFLDDPEQYAHIQSLWRDGRVVPLRGNLLGPQTFVELGEVLRASGLEVAVLYLSNAEQYFHYTAQFRANMLALPLAPDALVLRTMGWKQFGYVPGEYYHYNTQTGAGFHEWVGETKVQSAPKMLKERERTKQRGVSRLAGPARTP